MQYASVRAFFQREGWTHEEVYARSVKVCRNLKTLDTPLSAEDREWLYVYLCAAEVAIQQALGFSAHEPLGELMLKVLDALETPAPRPHIIFKEPTDER